MLPLNVIRDFAADRLLGGNESDCVSRRHGFVRERGFLFFPALKWLFPFFLTFNHGVRSSTLRWSTKTKGPPCAALLFWRSVRRVSRVYAVGSLKIE